MVKGQFWSLDVIFAIVIFSFTITILALTWFNISNELSIASTNTGSIISVQAASFADSLLSPGSPANWYSQVNTTNTITWTSVSPGIGSSAQYGYISSQKLYALAAMANYNYRATKSAFGIQYDYFIDIQEEAQGPILPAVTEEPGGINFTIGVNPNTNHATTVYVERRSATLNGVPVSVDIFVWTNSTLGAG